MPIGQGCTALAALEDDRVAAMLAEVFERAQAHVVPFLNPLTGGESANTVYLAVRPRR